MLVSKVYILHGSKILTHTELHQSINTQIKNNCKKSANTEIIQLQETLRHHHNIALYTYLKGIITS